MSGKRILLPLPTDNPVGSTPTRQGTDGHPADHDKIREILAVLVDGFVPEKLGDLTDVNTDTVGDGVGAGYVLVWDGGKFAPVKLPTPITGAIASGTTLRLQYPDGSFSDVALPQNTGPDGPAGAAGRGIASLAFTDVGSDRHLTIVYTDDPNNEVDLGVIPRGLPGSSGADGLGVKGITVNAAGRLIVTLSDGTTIDAGNVVGPAGVGSFADSFRGMYSATTTYAKNDIVSSGGDTYFSRVDNNIGNTPVPDQTSAQWAILALNGAKGDTGGQGPVGATPQLSIGTVSTVDYSGTASATLGGTPAAPVLNLSLPRGDVGLKGDRGIDGTPGTPGNPGAPGRSVSALTLSPTNVLTVTYSDNTSTAVGTIATLKGDKGDTGTAGTNGTAGAPGRGITSLALAGNVLSAVYTDSPNSVAIGTITGAQQVRGLWSATTAYAARDVVGYMGMLYQANAVIPAAAAPFSAPLTSTVAPMVATGGTPDINSTSGALLGNGVQLSANPDTSRTTPVGYSYQVRLTTDTSGTLAYVGFGSGPSPTNSEYSAAGGANIVISYDGTTIASRLGQSSTRTNGPTATVNGRGATVDLTLTLDASSVLRVQASVNGATATSVLTWNLAQYNLAWLTNGITYYLYGGTGSTTRFSQVLVTPTGTAFPSSSFTMLTTDRQQVRGAWTASTDYLANDVATYQGVLYQALNAHNSGASFTAAQWLALTSAASGGTSTPVGAAVTRTTTLAVPNNATTLVPFTAQDANSVAGTWSATTNPERLAATVTGWHTVAFSLKFASQTGASRRALLSINGAGAVTAATAAPSDFNDPFVTSAANVFLNAGDYLTLSAYQNSGTSVNVTAASLSFVR